MPTARELLEQADALMRRNRARQIDTEIPELTDAVEMPLAMPLSPASAEPHAPTSAEPHAALDDIPELTDAVEEIEIASIAEMPDDDVEPSGWRSPVRDEHAAAPVVAAVTPIAPAPIGGRVLPLFAIAAVPNPAASAASAAVPSPPGDADGRTPATEAEVAVADVVDLPRRDATRSDEAVPALVLDSRADAEAAPVEVAGSEALPAGTTAPDGGAPDAAPREAATTDDVGPERGSHGAAPPEAAPADTAPPDAAPVTARRPEDEENWARWEALAEEIRMQVLQRIDIFTDTGLREQLSRQMQPIVDRASAEMVATINEQVGKLLRAYIAEAIEREIEKWRKGNA